MTRRPHEGLLRYIKANGTQVAWAIDYSVYAVEDLHFLIYTPDPLSELAVQSLSVPAGIDPRDVALAFLADHTSPKGRYGQAAREHVA